MRTFLSIVLSACAATAALNHTSPKTTTVSNTQANDTVFKALVDEMGRSVKRLHIEGHQTPYYLAYTVRDIQSLRVAGSFGAVTEKNRNHTRSLDVDLRLGDYSLDSSSALSGSGGGLGRLAHMYSQSGSLPVDENYDALRHKLWLRTDSAYKSAVENLESYKRYLKDNNVEDRPDSLSHEQPVVLIKPATDLSIDADKWAGIIRKLSANFRNYPEILRSSVSLAAQADTRWFVNNEGFKNRVGEECFVVTMNASAQAKDGMTVTDSEFSGAYTEKELPPVKALDKSTSDLAGELLKIAKAPLSGEYRGPVLFEGQAGAQFFHQILDAKLCGNHANALQQMLGSDTSEHIGQRILPKFISIVDDPSQVQFKGTRLFGTYDVDDDGVKGQKITLVDKGILKTFCMSRTPTKEIKQSNGHSRLGQGATSNLFIVSDSKVPLAQLKQQLIEMGKDDGLKEVYIVRKITGSPLELDSAGLQAIMKGLFRGSSGVVILPPVLVYKVSVADGHEELVRGAQFGDLTMRVLRDIEATGDDTRAYPVVKGQDITSIVAPSVLVKEVELQKPERVNSKPSVLKNPYFDK